MPNKNDSASGGFGNGTITPRFQTFSEEGAKARGESTSSKLSRTTVVSKATTRSPGRKLYHGTKSEIKPGTVLRSGKKFGASATTRQSVAKDYATKRLSIGKNAKPKVYEVKTRGKLTGPQGKGKPGVGKSATGEVNSNKSFRVVREVKPNTKTTNQLRKNARFN
jgi:hypothetical protein